MKMIGKQGIDLIKSYEGLRTKAYQCTAGVWTIGYGHTKGVKSTDIVTKEQADKLLKKDLYLFEIDLNRLLKVNINQEQFDALISLIFNIGTWQFSKSTLLKKLNAGDYQGAADEFLVWNKSGGRVVRGLVKRREEERKLFLSHTL